MITKNSDIVIDSRSKLLNIFLNELLEIITKRIKKKINLIEIDKNSHIYKEIENKS